MLLRLLVTTITNHVDPWYLFVLPVYTDSAVGAKQAQGTEFIAYLLSEGAASCAMYTCLPTPHEPSLKQRSV